MKINEMLKGFKEELKALFRDAKHLEAKRKRAVSEWINSGAELRGDKHITLQEIRSKEDALMEKIIEVQSKIHHVEITLEYLKDCNEYSSTN